MTSVRGVLRPPLEWAARSCGPIYASTSTSRPHSRRPSTSRTRTLSSRSRATTRVSRSKNDDWRIRSAAGFVKPLLGRVTAALVDVERLVGGLVHGLPVEALPPGGDADAELDGHRKLG